VRAPLISAVTLVLCACGNAPIAIQSAGGSFPFPLYFKWFGEFQERRPDVWVNYQSIGSGGGIRQLMAGTVDFAAIHVPMTGAEMARMPKRTASMESRIPSTSRRAGNGECLGWVPYCYSWPTRN